MGSYLNEAHLISSDIACSPLDFLRCLVLAEELRKARIKSTKNDAVVRLASAIHEVCLAPAPQISCYLQALSCAKHPSESYFLNELMKRIAMQSITTIPKVVVIFREEGKG